MIPVALAAVAVLVLLIWRLYACLPKPGKCQFKKGKVKLLAVLGSGGHTTEMFYDLGTLPHWTSRFACTYVVADTDKGSSGKAHAFEKTFGQEASIAIVPRAREVGQSYFTSIFTTLRSSVTSFTIVLSLMPDLIVCNGPGTCVPICAAAYFARFFGLKRIPIIYSESMACVDHLSMSGKILRKLADRFTVQWEPVHKMYPGTLYAGRCSSSLPLLSSPPAGSGTALVTVGSTKFDGLIKACDSMQFLAALKKLGITRVVIQRGNGYYPQKIKGCAEILDYTPELPSLIRNASLVISHAGAGTVLDCLLHDRRLIVVPNEALMSNHQVQLAVELARYDLVQWCRPADLQSLVESPQPERRAFPKQPSDVFVTCVTDLVG